MTNNETEESFMIRKFLMILLVFITVFTVSFADGLKLTDDAADVRVYLYDELQPDGPSYTYSYCYPCIDDSEACAAEINSFYSYIIDDTLNFANPMMVDDLHSYGIETSSREDISYTLCCNNGEYFSILIKKHSFIDGYEDLIYEGHTFLTGGGHPGSTVALPYLLGLLESNNNDTWLQDRQTQKAESFTRELVWESIMEKADAGDLVLYEEIDEDFLTDNFYPEEDFYLDENGDPVFFIQPGRIADLSYGLIEIPISLDTLYDEF